MEIINPGNLAKPIGFNHGILTRSGRILWLAGQDASDPDGRVVAPGDLPAQFEQVLNNLKAVLHHAGGELEQIVKLNIYTTDMQSYKANLESLGVLMKQYFHGHYPALALFEVKGLYQAEAMIEMEGFAILAQDLGSEPPAVFG